nr:hypothetical protein [uncultured Bdellovibrio sp.]
MFSKSSVVVIIFAALSFVGCGLKVINPNDKNPNEGTLALDTSNGVKLVATYTCKVESMGNRYSAMAKSEEEARREVLYKCKSNTLISSCDPQKVKCVKN